MFYSDTVKLFFSKRPFITRLSTEFPGGGYKVSPKVYTMLTSCTGITSLYLGFCSTLSVEVIECIRDYQEGRLQEINLVNS